MNPLVQPDPGLYIWTILTFLILVALLAKFAWKPLLQALDDRQQSIRKALDDARKAKQELEAIHAESAKLLASGDDPIDYPGAIVTWLRLRVAAARARRASARRSWRSPRRAAGTARA